MPFLHCVHWLMVINFCHIFINLANILWNAICRSPGNWTQTNDGGCISAMRAADNNEDVGISDWEADSSMPMQENYFPSNIGTEEHEEEAIPTSMLLMSSSSAHDKYIVFYEQDMELISIPCATCPGVSGVCHPEPYVSLTAVSGIWPDSMLFEAIFFSGCLASQTLRMLNILTMLSISPITFTRHQRDYVVNGPEHMARTASSPRSRTGDPRWEFGGVGELSYDSPGQCKYSSYFVVE